MARPQSEVRVDMMAALVDGPGTCRELAQRTGWSIGMARRALDNMARVGDVRKRFVRVPGVCRPVPVYERGVRMADAVPVDHASLRDVLAGWHRWPAFAAPAAAGVRGAAM